MQSRMPIATAPLIPISFCILRKAVPEAPSPMALRRWMLSINTINGNDCIHNCSSSFQPPSQPTSFSHHIFANTIIAAVCVVAAVLFLVLTYYTVLARRRRSGNVATAANLPSEQDGIEADYPFWRIRTVGLDESTINSISVKPYINGVGSTADCSVCLAEFRDGELVRLLPACGHAFHVPCIDTWLRAHISCPLCRAHVIVSSDSGSEVLASMYPDGNALISDRRVSGSSEDNRGREIGVDNVADSSLDGPENSILRDGSHLPGNRLQRLCQSNSFHSLPGRDLFLSLDKEEICQDEKKERKCYCSDEENGNEKKGKQRCSPKGDCLQKCLAEIEGGSTSGTGRILFFSRCGRARSSSVLPL
ncbi:LOW QUALITY PROTEIN: putative RING-H2 finger protein ATL53 [Phalaenopsis equestris]|uniref:LOW QUALITY PROTEIN: putative RING-H2 finger protein ATL53 n=1 Tax=Phalaenopsis equestris TaxID=78828 RepID=UPI0009E3C1BC|nr:LOW QUALITY PROTEIN: putative RING-H2 finger protein ATL53 [Phalaenopsis equestris]